MTPDEQVPATAGPDGDIPADAERRLHSGVFSSGLSVPAFAACLHMGLRPVSFVQGFCVMRWSWYGAGSPYMRGNNPYSSGSGRDYHETYNCPHGYVSAEHRAWGQNYAQPWVEQAWSHGFGTAYRRMVEEAEEAGAHGIIGVVDTTARLASADVLEFHLTGTAVVIEDSEAPDEVWTTYLAGQRLAKLIEAGFMPVSVAASISSIRVWAYCITEALMSGRTIYGGGLLGGGVMGGGRLGGYNSGGFTGAGGFGSGGGGYGGGVQEVTQLSRAHMVARRKARDKVRAQIGTDTLHGASMSVEEREIGEADQVITCILKGTRVRPFKSFDPLPAPVPTVRLT